MSAAPLQAPVRILDLSDIHLRAGKAWDSDPVLRALSRFVAREVEAGLVPDLVIATKDLAFKGKKDEYDLARIFVRNQAASQAVHPSGWSTPRR